MDSKWLEDFISLADTRNFSRSAQERHVTQPAFSRRIRALEAWVGAELVDRSIYPTALTPAGRMFREQAAEILRQLNDVRSLLRGEHRTGPDMLQVAAGHTLAVTFFPRWISRLERNIGALPTRLVATNVHDAVLAFVESGCDLLLCYNHPRLPILLDSSRHESILLGREALIPVSVPGPGGEPLYNLPARRGCKVPLVAYSPTSYLGRAADLILQGTDAGSAFDYRSITERSEAVKALALESFGLAWLPESVISRELAERRLVQVGGGKWTLELEIRLFRSKDNRKPALGRVWDHLRRPVAGVPAAEKSTNRPAGARSRRQ